MLNMACCLSNHARFNHPRKEKTTVLNKAPVARSALENQQ